MSTTWNLINGDAFDVSTGLPSLKPGEVDVILTDPPYSEHVHSKGLKGGKRGRKIADARPLGFDSFGPNEIQRSALHFARVAKRWILVFCDVERSAPLWRSALEAVGLDVVRIGFWHKVGSAPQFTGDRPAANHEAIVIAHPPGRKRWNGGGSGSVWQCPPERGEHPTQKPIALCRLLVQLFSDPGDVVADPFAGVASTGVACTQLGRYWIGWERSPGWYALGRSRLQAEREQGDLFAPPVPRRKVRQLSILRGEQ